jgi:hypothetical protein
MKWPLVWRKTYEEEVRQKAVYRDAYVGLNATRLAPQSTTVSDAQVQQVVAAIGKAADEIVAAVKAAP